MNDIPKLAAGSRVVRFGTFELDPRTGELRNRGLRVKLQDKPLAILLALLERPGEIVTREALRKRLWSSDTFVDFDRSLNTSLNRLRRTLGDVARNPRFVETLSRRGYRFIVLVESGADGIGLRRPPLETVHSLAVLPFENLSANPEMDFLGDGLTESLISSLSRLPNLGVIARNTAFRYKGKSIDPQSVGRELRVQALLMGSVNQRGKTLRVVAELVDAERGWVLWSEQYSRDFANLPALEKEISQEISERLKIRLSQEQKARLAKRFTESAGAYTDYLKGRYFWNQMSQAGLEKSITCFQAAIAKDPGYALAYAGLAGAYTLIGFFGIVEPREVMPKAESAVAKALELDDQLTEAHASSAALRKLHAWDWAGAEAEYRRALELNPNYIYAHHGYADFLSALGRFEEALTEIHHAQQLDPLSLIVGNEVAWNCYMARDYPRALEQSLATLEMHADFAPALHTLGLAYAQVGRFRDAVDALQKGIDHVGDNPVALASLGNTRAVAGERQEAQRILANLATIAKSAYVPCYCFALIYAGLGENHMAMEYLERACTDHDVWLVWTKVDPRLDGLRRDARFRKLLQRIGLVD